jgi:hypothetical protein
MTPLRYVFDASNPFVNILADCVIPEANLEAPPSECLAVAIPLGIPLHHDWALRHSLYLPFFFV